MKMEDKKVIVTASGGWAFIGMVEKYSTEHGVTLYDASCIRRWGTTRGLGQIALNGPTEDTILDPVGTVHIPATALGPIIMCQK